MKDKSEDEINNIRHIKDKTIREYLKLFDKSFKECVHKDLSLSTTDR